MVQYRASRGPRHATHYIQPRETDVLMSVIAARILGLLRQRAVQLQSALPQNGTSREQKFKSRKFYLFIYEEAGTRFIFELNLQSSR
jgi:hypothetical protein